MEAALKTAVALFDAGDLDGLRQFVASQPAVLSVHGSFEPPYFNGATLLHHIAGNPYRCPLPANVVEIARMLLAEGAEADARAHGGTAMDLIITSQHCSERGFSAPLMELLLQHGAALDVNALDLPLANHAPRAAEKMIELGGEVDLCAAAALGWMDRLRALAPRRGLSQRDTIGLALLFAYVNRQYPAVDFLLEQDGNWNMIGVNHGTALHRAAGSGDLAMVQRLLKKGADLNDRNNPYHATPLSWAFHEQRQEVFAWMMAHCPIDLRDAIWFNSRQRAEARIAEDPSCVNRVLDHWPMPLALAEARGNQELAQLLRDHGAL